MRSGVLIHDIRSYITPVGSVDFSNNVPDVGSGGPNGIAAAASNILEFYKLSQYTGNQTYFEYANRTMYTIAANPNPIFPGLPPQEVNKDGTPSGSTVTQVLSSLTFATADIPKAGMEAVTHVNPRFIALGPHLN